MNTLIDDIQYSESLAALQSKGVLPEPYSHSGYYFVYYSRKDYKIALKDIVQMSDSGLRVWYDRKMNSGKSWEADMLEKARSFRCACVVLYLSVNALESPFFWQLCKLIETHHLVYCTINIPDFDGYVCSGLETAKQLNLSVEQMQIAQKLFSNEVTFIPGNITYEEKLKALDNVKKNERLVFATEKNYAIVVSVKDLSEEKIVIPEQITIGEKEYIVKRIAPRAFADCERLREIYLPDCIEYVGDQYGFTLDDDEENDFVEENSFSEGRVFQNCSALEEIKLPASLKVIHTNLFIGCTNLKRIYFGDEVVSVKGNNWFDIGKEEVNYDGSLEEGDIKQKSVIEEIKLPSIFIKRHDGVILYPDYYAGWRAFIVEDETHIYGYTNSEPQTHYIAKKGEKVGDRFVGDNELKFIDMRLSSDQKYFSFEGCTSLEKVCLPDALERIERGRLFADCPSLKEITLPKNLKYVEPETFEDSCVETIVSDAIHNKLSFRSLSFIRLKYRNIKKMSKKIAYTIFSPIIMFFSLFAMLFQFRFAWFFPLIGLLGIATFPITFWIMLFRPALKPFYLKTSIKTIYLRKNKKGPLKLKGFELVISDREGYYMYTSKK